MSHIDSPICLIFCTAISTDPKEKALNIITDKEKEKYFFYKPLNIIEGYIIMLTSYDSLLAKRKCQMNVILKKLKILAVKEANANRRTVRLSITNDIKTETDW